MDYWGRGEQNEQNSNKQLTATGRSAAGDVGSYTEGLCTNSPPVRAKIGHPLGHWMGQVMNSPTD